MKHILYILTILLLLPLCSIAKDIPLATAICINKANMLIKQNKIDRAVLVLEKFATRQQTFNKNKNIQKKYNHYYIDFLLGNCFLMLDQKNQTSGNNQVANKNQESGKNQTFNKNQKTGENQITDNNQKLDKNPITSDSYLKKATQAFTQSIKKKPDFAPAWLNLARCQYELGNMKKAALAFIQGYETSKEKKPENLYYASVCYTSIKNYKKALSIFNKLINVYSDKIEPEWQETLINIYFSMEKQKQALPWIKKLIKVCKEKKKKQWQEVLLYQYLTLKMDKKALDYARFLTQTDPLEPKWWKALTNIYLTSNNLKNGLASFIIYSFISPLSVEETKLMANLYMACNIPIQANKFQKDVINNK